MFRELNTPPFGKERYVLNPSLEELPKYTGQTNDIDTDLYYYNSRYYDPVLARFIQPDSIIPDVYQSQTLNPYSYVLNNPLKYTDPTGHESEHVGRDEDGFGGISGLDDPAQDAFTDDGTATTNTAEDRAQIDAAIHSIDQAIDKIDETINDIDRDMFGGRSIADRLGWGNRSDRLGPDFRGEFGIGAETRAALAVDGIVTVSDIFGWLEQSLEIALHFSVNPVTRAIFKGAGKIFGVLGSVAYVGGSGALYGGIIGAGFGALFGARGGWIGALGGGILGGIIGSAIGGQFDDPEAGNLH